MNSYEFPLWRFVWWFVLARKTTLYILFLKERLKMEVRVPFPLNISMQCCLSVVELQSISTFNVGTIKPEYCRRAEAKNISQLLMLQKFRHFLLLETRTGNSSTKQKVQHLYLILHLEFYYLVTFLHWIILTYCFFALKIIKLITLAPVKMVWV